MVNHVEFPGLGLSFEIDRVAFCIGDFCIYWYGVLLATGLMLGILFAMRYAVDFGINADRMTDAIIVGTVCAIVCARAYYVAFAPFEYESIWEMIDIRDGGIAIYGSVIGAFVFGGLACKVRKVPVLPMFDLTAMGFLIGQSIGRWGNFMNQEAFGGNTTLPWGMYSESTHNYLAAWQQTLEEQGMMVDPSLPVHPTFLYESLWCALAFFILFAYMKKRRFNGEILLLYIILYGAERFVVEGLRTDSLIIPGLGLRVSQVVALGSVAVALVLELWMRRKTKGAALEVELAEDDFKLVLPEGTVLQTETCLPATASHKEFAEKTKAMNRERKELKEAAVRAEEIPEAELPKTEEPEKTSPEFPEEKEGENTEKP